MAVVILNHNGGQDVIRCIRSVRLQDPSQIVVIDNASTDGSDASIAQRFKEVELVRNRRNVGFAAGANQGIALTTAPYVLLLNQDAIVDDGALAALAAALDGRLRAAAVGASVRNPDGTVQPTRRAFPSISQSFLHGIVGVFRPNNPGTKGYTLIDADLDELSPVDWVAMTATALRREAFDAVGGFDERYFFFVEDVDLCRRLTDAGWEVWFEPLAGVVHEWGGSWTRKPLRFMWLHQWNLFRYVRKHYRGAWIALWPVIALGLLARFTLLALRWLITRRSVPEHRSISGKDTGISG
jgi:GT2 family glycosyltransferase